MTGEKRGRKRRLGGKKGRGKQKRGHNKKEKMGRGK